MSFGPARGRIPISYMKSLQPSARYMKSKLPVEEYKKAIDYDPHNFVYIPDSERTPEICTYAMEKAGYTDLVTWIQADPYMFPYLAPDMLTEEACLAFFSVKNMDKEKFGHFWEKGIPHSGRRCVKYLEFKHFMKWESVCRAAVEFDGRTIKGVPSQFLTQELCDMAFDNTEYAFCFIPTKYRTKEMSERAVRSYYRNLEYVPMAYKSYDLCLETLKSDIYAYKYIPKKHRIGEIEAIWQDSPQSKIYIDW